MNRKNFLQIFSLILLLLFISGGCSNVKKAQEEAKSSFEDAKIASKIQAELAKTNLMSFFQIEVYSEYGVVTLQGRVKDEKEKNLASEIAGKVEGVKAVKNLLTVDASSFKFKISESNPGIAAMVKSSILKYAGLSAFNIKVKVSEWVVTLEGKVDMDEQKSLAEKAALKVEGVKKVINNIVVNEK